jgi:hypothetical protein
MPRSSIIKKIEVTAHTSPVSKSSSTHRHRALQTVADCISQDADAMSVASALSEQYISALQRILRIRIDLDRARQLQRAHHPGWEQLMRVARFAWKDEMEYFRLVDQACRGLCDCLGVKTRISFETIAKINARNDHDTPEELLQQHTRDLLEKTMLRKAIMYNLTLPDEFLRHGLEGKPKAHVDQNIKKTG